MLQLNLRETTLKRLHEIAHRRQQSAESIVEQLVEDYLKQTAGATTTAEPPDLSSITAEMVGNDPALAEMFHERGLMAPGEPDPLEAFVGIIDSDETDISETVRETLAKHSHPLYGWTLKDDRSD